MGVPETQSHIVDQLSNFTDALRNKEALLNQSLLPISDSATELLHTSTHLRMQHELQDAVHHLQHKQDLARHEERFRDGAIYEFAKRVVRHERTRVQHKHEANGATRIKNQPLKKLPSTSA